jgi:hypothetical protein
LRRLLDEAGWSYAEFARWVNAVGEEHGLHLTYRKNAVTRWLAGAEPHWPTAAMVADALGRRLGCEVAVAELGWRDRGMPAGCDNDGSALEPSAEAGLRTVASLAGRDLERRTFLRGVGFVAGAFAGPALVVTTVPAAGRLASSGSRRLSMADAESVRETVNHFRRLDQRFGGGGRLRAQVVGLLRGEVRAMLDGSFSSAVGQRLYAAGAELARLAGYMSFDAGRHALAQRYYIQSLGLAHAADDPVEVAVTLSTMSFQAVHLGDGRESVALARAALRAQDGPRSPALTSMLHAIEARGLALLGHRSDCARALRAAEDDLGRSVAAEEPSWLRYYDAAELSHHAAHCMRDLDQPGPAYGLACEALSGYPDSAVRSRAFARTVQASALLGQREVEQACTTALDAVDIAGRIQSARAVDWLRDFQRRLQPFAGVPAAREFTERSRAILSSAG